MGWKYKNSDMVWDGETHELAGRTFTGATRTSESAPLVWVEESKKIASPSKPRQPRKKQPPKPKGATAWD
jgi:hypothetical protein